LAVLIRRAGPPVPLWTSSSIALDWEVNLLQDGRSAFICWSRGVDDGEEEQEGQEEEQEEVTHVR
jgi:hypothetical protein